MKGHTFEIGGGIRCDVDRLVASRLLVQANSGGGKTRTVRRILEQSHGKVQHLIIDPEGEYATLRERFDYVIAAPAGGDTAAHPRTAALLAETLLKVGVSAILDIYELDPKDRTLFVERFVGALVNAGRALWHPVLVGIDEAHIFAPEGGEASSAGAIAALASRGRKRGYALMAITQRLALLSKTVAAECNNVLIGRCALDVDIKRAAATLGFAKKEDQHGLRRLEPGQFWAFGQAFGVEAPTLLRVGPVVSRHQEAGEQAAPVPPPTAAVLRLLPQLADLPAEAEAREQSIESLRRDVSRLTTELAAARRAQPAPAVTPPPVEVPVIADAQLARVEQLGARVDALITRTAEAFAAPIADLRRQVAELTAAVQAVRQPALPLPAPARQARRPSIPSIPPAAPMAQASSPGDSTLPVGERATLTAVAQRADGATRVELSVVTGYKKSSRDTYIKRLVGRGYVTVDRDRVLPTASGLGALGSDYEPLPTGEALRRYWEARLPDGERAVLQAVVPYYPDAAERSAIDQVTGYKKSSRDTYIKRLAARQLVTTLRGAVRASDALFS